MSGDHGLRASGTGSSPSLVGTKYPRSSLAIGRSSHTLGWCRCVPATTASSPCCSPEGASRLQGPSDVVGSATLCTGPRGWAGGCLCRRSVLVGHRPLVRRPPDRRAAGPIETARPDPVAPPPRRGGRGGPRCAPAGRALPPGPRRRPALAGVVVPDQSDAMVDLARRHAGSGDGARHHLRRGRRADSCWPSRTSAFDGATCQLGLMDIPDLDATLARDPPGAPARRLVRLRHRPPVLPRTRGGRDRRARRPTGRQRHRLLPRALLALDEPRGRSPGRQLPPHPEHLPQRPRPGWLRPRPRGGADAVRPPRRPATPLPARSPSSSPDAGEPAWLNQRG